ncbi:Fic family protein [Mycobacterium sp. MAA66]|uniref:Fic family protein n=1 Tax=Mycobacterium sp. MAA66 TaxID=3156297 RepID=UPI0035125D6C
MVEPAESAIYVPFPSFAQWRLNDLSTEDFDNYAKLLADAKRSAAELVLAAAMEAAQRYAAVDTNAIEGIYEVDRGFTRTVATQAAAWEAMMAARGPHVRPAFDDALNGYEYVLDAATQKVEITEKWIKEIHEIICSSQKTYKVYTAAGPQEQPLPKGAYKTMPNSPTLLDGRVHAYAPVMDTKPEMQRLLSELKSKEFLAAHPVVQAAYAHYAYVCIHPFSDGNGRVARALSSVYLYRNPGVPLIVFADQRNEYYDALEQTDQGSPVAFVRFIATQTIDSMNLIRTLLGNTAPPVAETLSNLNDLFNSGANEAELVAAGTRLANMAVSEANKQINELALPPALKINILRIRIGFTPSAPAGYIDVGDEAFWSLNAKSDRPVRIQSGIRICTFIKSSEASASELLMASRENDGLEVWMREITPSASETLKLKLAAWVEAKLSELLATVEKELRKTANG